MITFYCLIPLAFIIIATVAVRRNNGLPRQAKALYLLTLLLEIPGTLARAMVTFLLLPLILAPLWLVFALILGIVMLVTLIGHGNVLAVGASVGGFFLVLGLMIVTVGTIISAWGPPIWSVLCVLGLRGGHFVTRYFMLARRLSTREMKRYLQSLSHLQSMSSSSLLAPSHVFAIKSPEVRMWTIGSTLYITSGALKSPHLMALLAHELAMVNSPNGRLVLALRRFVVPPMYLVSMLAQRIAPGNFTFAVIAAGNGRPMGMVLYIFAFLASLAGGGMGILLTSPLWAWQWRKSITEADLFAASLGMANPLIDYLETHEYLDVAMPYLLNPTIDSELRIDALQQYQMRHVAQTVNLTMQPQN